MGLVNPGSGLGSQWRFPTGSSSGEGGLGRAITQPQETAEGCGQGAEEASGTAWLLSMGSQLRSYTPEHEACLEPSFAPRRCGSVGQGKAGPPCLVPAKLCPCSAQGGGTERGHGEGYAGRGAAAWGPP